MKKAECEKTIRMLCRRWAAEIGVGGEPKDESSYPEFRAWLNVKGYSSWLSFRSATSAEAEAERWFADELQVLQRP